jgi:PAS domain-containing protein
VSDLEKTRQIDRPSQMGGNRWRLLLQQMPGFDAVLIGPEHVFEYVNDAYLAISGPRKLLGRSVREVFPEVVGQGFYELLDRAFTTGESYAARAIPIRLAGEDLDRYIEFLYQPIRDDQGVVSGIFVGGHEDLRPSLAVAMS